jgi:RNA polymerase sigma-B factor
VTTTAIRKRAGRRRRTPRGRRDARARERAIRDSMPLATSIARRYVHGDPDLLEDLTQVAAIGLINAVDRYDPDSGNAFSSFAVPTIQGEIRRYFRDHRWAVRVPRDLQERAVRIERDRDHLTEELGRNPTAEELAGWCSCSVEDVIDAMEAANARVGESLDRPVRTDDDESQTLAERLGADDDGFDAADARASLAPLLATLSERERTVLLMYLRDDLTQAEIGRRIGFSQMHVSRIYRGALAKLTARAADGG